MAFINFLRWLCQPSLYNPFFYLSFLVWTIWWIAIYLPRSIKVGCKTFCKHMQSLGEVWDRVYEQAKE